MRELTSKRLMVLTISFALLFVFSVTTSLAQQKMKIAGKMTCANVNREAINIGDAEGHTMYLTEAEGINVSTGQQEFLDGAQVVSVSFSDLAKGNGPHQGYVKLAKKDDAAFRKYEGEVTTILSADGTPMITFKGTFSYIKGTGQLENIKGGGTYKGRYISKTIYTVEWEGEYSIKK